MDTVEDPLGETCRETSLLPSGLLLLFELFWVRVPFYTQPTTKNALFPMATSETCWCGGQGMRNGMTPINHLSWFPFRGSWGAARK